MLLSLQIHNFVLIDKASIEFKPGLNIITGETGSGKSAVIDALNLVLGRRADTDMIRKGQEKATVEAIFDTSRLFEVNQVLENMGLNPDSDQVHIKRDIARDGKGRIWINRELVPLTALKTLASHLMEFVGQKASSCLTEPENHLDILDKIANLYPDRKAFKEAHLLQLKKEKQLQRLIINREEAAKNWLKQTDDLKEIELISPQEGEEETLFEEYARLSRSEELKEGLLSISLALGGEEILQSLTNVKKKLEEFVQIDGTLQESLNMTQEAIANMKEVERFVDRKLSHLDENPERLSYLDLRLKSLNRLKKLYGPSMKDVFSKWDRLLTESKNYENTEESEEELKEEIRSLIIKADTLSKNLTAKRVEASAFLSLKVTSLLRTLNMPSALFTVSFKEKTRSETGDDLIDFELLPNLGENPVSVSLAASGGELSRVLLALKLIEETPSPIVFDEIDANIGGNTAVMVGEKLKSLSLKKQVILITHFQQVARFACHHIKISKKESLGRTFTSIEPIEAIEREKELARMLGSSYQ